MGSITDKIRDMEEEEMRKKQATGGPVSPNLDVSNILYDHYFAACLSGLLGNAQVSVERAHELIDYAHELTLAAIAKRNGK